MDDFFAELDAEISKHLASTKLKSEREAAKKRANTMTLPQATRQRAKEEYHALNKALEASEWEKVSTVALFTEQHCDGCGSTHKIFLQYMELQQMIRRPSTQRWARVSRPTEGLPRETLIQPVPTHLCADCCEDHGFALLTAERLASRATPPVPSFTYEQDDLNAQAA